MKTINDIRTELLSFNSHPMVCSIREKYNTPSFFEMIDKTRSETSHSAFLSWMLKGQGVSETSADTPLYLFLSVLAKRSLQQEATGTLLMNPTVRDAILSRRIKISNAATETETSVSELAELAYDSYDPTTDSARCNLLSDIIATVADRVDIVVKCNVENCDGIKQLILVIENKIDSPEGACKATAKRKGLIIPPQYMNLNQTERYYEASHQKNTSDTAVIYVFLTPIATESDFACISSNRTALKNGGKIAQSDNYININYQDILNGVIDNALLLQEGSITKRTRNFLEEYKNEITYPHIDNPKTHINIAYPQIDGIEDLWKRFRFLFHCIAYSTVSNKGCVAVDGSETIYCTTYQDRVLSIPASLQHLFTRGGSPVQSTSIGNFCSVLSLNNIIAQPINSDELLAAGVSDLLSDFANENLEIMSTIIGAVKFSSPQYAGEADELFKVLMSGARDNTKYFVSYTSISLTPKPVSKSEVAYLIFREWAKANNANIAQMRNAFPVNINPYYASVKYFQHLFYSYSPTNNYYFDGSDPKFGNNVPCTGNWDFYHDNLHEYSGITNLKMWRKDAFDSLIDHIKKNLPTYSMHLDIVDTLGNRIL